MAQEPGSAAEPLRVAVIGYGVAGSVFHAPFIAAEPGTALAAVVTGSEERAAAARRRYPGVEVVGSPQDVWARAQDFDVVVVAAPNRAHVPLALQAVAAGLPVVVDKPVAPTAASAEQVRDTSAEAGVPVIPFHNRRWDGDFRTAGRLIEAGALGRVTRFESRFERWRPQRAAEAWKERPDPEEAGGILYDLGPHLIDQALVLFGPVESVYAESRCLRKGAEVPDDVFVALTHAGGTISHLWMSALAADAGPRLRVLGDAAAYVKHGMDVQEAALRAGGDPREQGWGIEPESSWGRVGSADDAHPEPTIAGSYGGFYAALVGHLRAGGPTPVSLDDAIAGLRVLEAAARSATERRCIRV